MATQMISTSELVAGDEITLSHGSLKVEDNAERSSALPLLIRVEVEVGALYLDPDATIEIQKRS